VERRVDPVPRSSPVEIAAQHALLSGSELLPALLGCFPEPVAALNARREIVAANRKLLELVGAREEELLGRRPGEALGCVHHAEHHGGCGESESCRDCGALLSVLGAISDDTPSTEECRLRHVAQGCERALDLRVHATPIGIGGERFVIFAVQDVTHEKRRQVLERIFFHDALNIAGGLQGLAELLGEQAGSGNRELIEELGGLSAQLVEEIRAQSDLAAAERGDLAVQPVAFDAIALCEQVGRTWRGHEIGRGRTVAVVHRAGPRVVHGDITLLRRVLGNLVKNALEASRTGETVTIEYHHEAAPRFTVHNPAVMRHEVRRQIFHRSFSTHGDRGRGVGLYSVRLLTERYLRGSVAFTSAPGDGTRFTITLPA